ncbi:MAG: thioredoxin domain-containing protein [Nitrospirae bacterium]|nr:thioredoxin domain-containing protein [Nitrospirota bacterium]
MSQDSTHKHTNRLIHETSPYLLQHAHNPVDWYPWGEEALGKAKEEDKPILLSIGYSACHWCHVMERESFENEETARIMNEHFVSIKVDREERPDLDEIYMAATVAMNNGHGGWPMTVFLAPDQRPFFAGTYFPPEDRYGRPGFGAILLKIAELWKTDRAALLQQGETLTEHIRRQAVSMPAQSVGNEAIEQAATLLAREFDPVHGGFGDAPKFPPSTALSFLLRVYRRTGDPEWLNIVRVTLGAMAKGGMYDQIGGGFCRYSTDEKWLVPHFEKMLYDNALLARIYLEAHQVTKDPFYKRIATEILDYEIREMISPEGGFYSSTDADSEGEEGKFFVWTPDEVKAVLGDENARHFCAHYDITEAGNWEGKNIPNTPRTLEQVASRLEISPETLQTSLESSRKKLYEERQKRTPPGRDDKILTSWNGLMIGATAEGARILGDPRYLVAAGRAADFLLKTLRAPDGRLLRTYRSGKAHLNAYLDDYAYLCEGLIDLYEAGGPARYLTEAAGLAERILTDFVADPPSADGGGFYHTSRDHERLILRHREGHDGATPNANASAAMALARLSFHLNREDWGKAAVAAVTAYGAVIDRFPRAFCKSLAVSDFLLEGPLEIVVVGKPGEAGYQALRREVDTQYLPNQILAHLDPAAESGKSPSPLIEGKGRINGKAALYLCHHFTCSSPITDPSRIGPALDAHQKRLQSTRRGSL